MLVVPHVALAVPSRCSRWQSTVTRRSEDERHVPIAPSPSRWSDVRGSSARRLVQRTALAVVAAPAKTEESHPMLDVFMLVLGIGFFALSVAYALACDRL